MDPMEPGGVYLLISIATSVLVAFVFSFLVIMLIYRKGKLKHSRDIKIMEEKFTQEILNNQLEIQQQTMQHIGREIHDNIGQKLTLAMLYMQKLDTENNNASTQKKITSISAIINESLRDLRSLSKNLTDTNGMDTDLYELISNECMKVNAAGSCVAELQSNTHQIKVSQALRNFVLRILQEFLQNSLKHAMCTEIKVQLYKYPKGLAINVFDNGKGFMSNDETHTGIGLRNMKKRAEIIGADLLIESSPGAGTKMHLFIPENKFNI